MDAKVDYLSFTVPINLSGGGHELTVYDAINERFSVMGLHGLKALLGSSAPEKRSGRKIYGAGLFWHECNVSLWWGGVANHLLVEVSGVGCQAMRDDDIMSETLQAVRTRTTRIDIAIDLADAGKPADFVAHKKENRFKVTETMDTDTGWTQYVGSRKSERFARVYLYKEPHPRSGVMRVEHVLRSEYAKSAVSMLLDAGIVELVATLGNTFGWEDARWQPELTTDGKLKAKRHDKEDAATLRWLAKAVAPALLKAHRNGLIDLREWLETHVLDQLGDTPD